MLAKSMHQIVQIEFRNAKFPYARGCCPLATPASGLAPGPPPGGQPPGTPVVVHQLGVPSPVAGSAPSYMDIHVLGIENEC